ncbi:endo-beta-N-acetylglucosaminidase [Streptomyces sp. Ac-502]|uniref:endo-beta-N-acetylglucosaminidase n=1 Tax=Streptomyces sp. Ac-502 TaxID=3342801 RepID=UPI0038628264
MPAQRARDRRRAPQRRQGVRQRLLSPTGWGGREAWVRDFTTKAEDGTYPVVDKLVKVAQYFGFDGWFINYETIRQGDAAIRAALAYGRSLSEPGKPGAVDFTWYEMRQRSLNDHNAQFLQHDNQRVCDSLFVDYYWDDSGLTNSKNKADQIKRPVHDLYFGLELVLEENWKKRLDLLFLTEDAHRGSLALYKAHTVSTPPKGVDDTTWTEHLYAKEAAFWTGPDPDHTSTGPVDEFPGIAHYVAEACPRGTLPFVTHFNTGHGHAYHHAGTAVRHGGWANLSLQDVLPTYRWLTGADPGCAVKADLSFRDAWEGGSCLMLDTHLLPGGSAWVRLYQLDLPVTPGTQLTVRAKTPYPDNSDCTVQMLIADAHDPETLGAVALTRGSQSPAGWVAYTAYLPDHVRTPAQLGLRLTAGDLPVHGPLAVGQIAVHDAAFGTPPAPTDLEFQAPERTITGGFSVRLAWQPPGDESAVHHYEIYETTAGTAETFLGAGLNPVFYLPQLAPRERAAARIAVTAVGHDGAHSPRPPPTSPGDPAGRCPAAGCRGGATVALPWRVVVVRCCVPLWPGGVTVPSLWRHRLLHSLGTASWRIDFTGKPAGQRPVRRWNANLARRGAIDVP